MSPLWKVFASHIPSRRPQLPPRHSQQHHNPIPESNQSINQYSFIWWHDDTTSQLTQTQLRFTLQT